MIKKSLVTSDEMIEQLKEIIDVPDNIISLKMTLESGSYVTMVIEKFLTADEGVERGIQPGTLIVVDKYVCVREGEFDEITKERDEALQSIENLSKSIENLSKKIDQYEGHGWDK